MYFDFNQDSSLLLIFVTQGLLFSLLLLRKAVRTGRASNYWLSAFVFLGTIYLWPWAAGHAGWYFEQPYRDILFYIPFHQVLLLGPVAWVYVQSLLDKSFRLSRRHFLHFLPAICYNLYILVVFLTDKVILNEYYFYADGRDMDLDKWYQIAGLLSMLTYFFLSLREYQRYRRLVFDLLSFADSVLFNWVRSYLIAFLAMQLMRLAFLLLYPGWGSFGAKWWYYMAFGALMQYIALTGYTNQVESVIALWDSPLKKKEKENEGAEPGGEMPTAEETTTDEEHAGKQIADPEAREMAIQLDGLMQEEELFRDPGLTLTALAERMHTHPRAVSRLVNQQFGMNFNDYVNHHRVEAVKQSFAQNEHERVTLLAIAHDCGFNSKTTFNRAFKKSTRLSPRAYLDQNGKPPQNAEN